MKYSPDELMAVVLSRELKDGEVGSPGGAYSEIPVSAVKLAQLTHAPNLVYICSTTGFICSARNADVPLFNSTTDYRNIYLAEAVFDMEQIFGFRRDFFFVGGIQIDKFGNINLIGIGDYPALKLRGPGTAGLAIASAISKRFYIYTRSHDRRVFVDRVQYRSGVGHFEGKGMREKLNLFGNGPEFVITPLAVLDFDEEKRMRIRSVHPGHTVEEVVENTGFDLVIPEKVPETEPPSSRELEILRDKVDKAGVLRKDV
ncbi:MAG: CoA-transferase subunit beta [Candidatus Syntropharchaeia archaeon]